ncbi:MAG: hypothetical protein QXT28_07940 [Thermofilaceae archaeon]
MSSERKKFEEKYGGLISLFRRLAQDKRFSPIDRMARALDPDMVRIALYDAMRIAVSEEWPLPPQREVEEFLEEIERNPGVAQKLAVIAITAAPVAVQGAGAQAGGPAQATQPATEGGSQQAVSSATQQVPGG